MSTAPAKLVAIEIDNFKSFKGKRSVEIKGKTISIIGPNGTGKSNFMDAICFALGATTSVLRVAKVEDLIHGAGFNGQHSLQNSVSTSLIFKTGKPSKSRTPVTPADPNMQFLEPECVLVESTPSPSRVDQHLPEDQQIQRTPMPMDQNVNIEHSFITSTPIPSSIGIFTRTPVKSVPMPVMMEENPVSPSSHSSDFVVRHAPVEQPMLIPAAEQPRPVVDIQSPSTHSSDFFVRHTQAEQPGELCPPSTPLHSTHQNWLLRGSIVSSTPLPSTLSSDFVRDADGEQPSLIPPIKQPTFKSPLVKPSLIRQASCITPSLVPPSIQAGASPIIESIIPSVESITHDTNYERAESIGDSDDNVLRFTRIVNKNNNGTAVSQYKINGKIVSYTEYALALQGLGLNIKANVFFIFQGKIEEVATKTPTELVNLFEQISGSVEYKDEYDHCVCKLNDIKSQETTNQFALKMLKKEKQYFQRATATSAQYDVMISEAKDAETLYFLFRLFINEREFRDASDQIESCQSLINNKRTNLMDREEHLKNMKKLKGEKERDVALMDSNIRQLKIDMENKDCVLITCKEAVLQAKRKVDTTEKVYHQTNMEHVNRMKSVEHLRNTLKDLNFILGEKTREFEALEKKLSFNASKLATYHTLNAQLSSRAGNLIIHLESLQRDRCHEIDKQESLNHRTNMRIERTNRTKTKIAECETRIAKIQTNLSNGQEELVKKREALASLEISNIQWKNETEQLTAELKDINDKIGDQNDTKIEHKKDDARNRILQALREQFDDRVIGRIKHLVTVSHQKYKNACLRILEPHINKIVVTDDHTAVMCVKFLKEKQLGRETFLPLESAVKRKLQQTLRLVGPKLRPQLSNDIKLMIDVLLYEPLIKPAIVWVTNNTLICETKDDARLVAYGSGEYKNAVSLDGTFYARSGLIKGGDVSHLARIDISSRVRIPESRGETSESEVNFLEFRRAEIVKRLIEIGKKSSASRLDIPNLTVAIQGLTKRNELCERELLFEQSNLKNLNSELEEFCGADFQTDYQGEIIEKAIAVIDEEIVAVKQEIGKMEQDVFADFCASVGVPNIEIFQQMCFSQYMKRQEELQTILNNISRAETELNYDTSRNTEKTLQQRQKEFEEAKLALELMEKQLASHQEDMASFKSTLEAQVLERNAKETELNVVECEVQHAYSELSKLQSEMCKLAAARDKQLVLLQQIRVSRHEVLREAKNIGATIPFQCGGWSKFDDAANLIQTPVENDPKSVAVLNREFFEIALDYSLLRERENLIDIDSDYAKTVEKKLREDYEMKEMKKNEHRPIKGNETSILRSLESQIKAKEKALYNLYKQKKAILTDFNKVRNLRIHLFNHMFEDVLSNIDKIYKDLTKSQGHIYFEINDPSDPFTSGIVYSVTPEGRSFVDPKKPVWGRKNNGSNGFDYGHLEVQTISFHYTR